MGETPAVVCPQCGATGAPASPSPQRRSCGFCRASFRVRKKVKPKHKAAGPSRRSFDRALARKIWVAFVGILVVALVLGKPILEFFLGEDALSSEQPDNFDTAFDGPPIVPLPAEQWELRATFELHREVQWGDESKTLELVGRVHNHAPVRIEYPEVEITFLDADGVALARTVESVYQEIPGRDYHPVELRIDDAPPHASLRFSLATEKAYQTRTEAEFHNQAKSIELVSHYEKHTDWTWDVGGKIKNVGGIDASSVHIYIEALDEEGKVYAVEDAIATTAPEAITVRVGEEARFRAIFMIGDFQPQGWNYIIRATPEQEFN